MALFEVEQPLLDAGRSMPLNLSGSSVMMGSRWRRIVRTVVRDKCRPLGRPERGDTQFLEKCSNTGFDGGYLYGQCCVAPATFTDRFEKERVGWA